MVNKWEWRRAIDDVICAVNAHADGPALHQAVSAYHQNPGNKKISIAMICGGCGATMYFAADRIYHEHWERGSTPDPVYCGVCGRANDHEYNGLAI